MPHKCSVKGNNTYQMVYRGGCFDALMGAANTKMNGEALAAKAIEVTIVNNERVILRAFQFEILPERVNPISTSANRFDGSGGRGAEFFRAVVGASR